MVLSKADVSPRTVVLGFAGAVRRLGASTCMIGGSIAFEVAGAGGEVWRLDLDVPGGACRKDDQTPAGTTVRATPAAMIALFLAPEQVTGLCASGALSVSGEVGRLHDLATKLRQTRSWLDRG